MVFFFGIPSLCQWHLNDLEYSGLSSHNPLDESMLGNISLSPEELQYLKKLRRARVAERKYPVNKQHQADVKAAQTYHCATCNYSASHKVNWDIYLLSKRHLQKVAGNALQQKPHRARNVVKKKYCAVCDYSAVHKQNLDVYNASKKHMNKVLQSSGNSSGSSSESFS
jgi:ribosomal protein L37E